MTYCCHISMTYEREVIMDAGTEINLMKQKVCEGMIIWNKIDLQI